MFNVVVHAAVILHFRSETVVVLLGLRPLSRLLFAFLLQGLEHGWSYLDGFFVFDDVVDVRFVLPWEYVDLSRHLHTLNETGLCRTIPNLDNKVFRVAVVCSGNALDWQKWARSIIDGVETLRVLGDHVEFVD